MRVRIRLSGWSGCRCRFRPSFSAMCSGTLFDGCGDSASLARAEEAEEEAEEGVEKEEVGVEKEEEECVENSGTRQRQPRRRLPLPSTRRVAIAKIKIHVDRQQQVPPLRCTCLEQV